MSKSSDELAPDELCFERGAGCRRTFLDKEQGLCPKCVELQGHLANSLAWKEIQALPQCTKCGHTMRTPSLCIHCTFPFIHRKDPELRGLIEQHSILTAPLVAEFGHRLETEPEPKPEPTPLIEEPKCKKQDVLRATAGALMNTTPGGAADDASAAELPPIAVPEGCVLVQLEAKIGTKTMHDLGMIQDMYTEDTPLQVLARDAIAAWNPGWKVLPQARTHGGAVGALDMRDVTLRRAGNVLIRASHLTLTVGAFVDMLRRTGLLTTPSVALELLIDHSRYEVRVEEWAWCERNDRKRHASTSPSRECVEKRMK